MIHGWYRLCLRAYLHSVVDNYCFVAAFGAFSDSEADHTALTKESRVTAVLVYDKFLVLSQEVDHIWGRKHLSIVHILYFLLQLSMLAVFGVQLALQFFVLECNVNATRTTFLIR